MEKALPCFKGYQKVRGREVALDSNSMVWDDASGHAQGPGVDFQGARWPSAPLFPRTEGG